MRRVYLPLALVLSSLAWAFFVGGGTAAVETVWQERSRLISTYWAGGTSEPASTAKPQASAAKPFVDDVTPRLPALVTVVAGRPMTLYADGLLLTKDSYSYKFRVDAGGVKVVSTPRAWTLSASAADVGDHKLEITVQDWNGRELARTQSVLRVVPNTPPARAPDQAPLSVLLVGDSLTEQSVYPNQLFEKLAELTAGKVNFVGTHQPIPEFPFYARPLPKVFHEGYGGWTWQRFLDHYKPEETKTYKAPRSPFVFLEEGAPKLDVQRFLRERNLKTPLDVVVFQLGINDSFGFDPKNSEKLNSQIAAVLASADGLIAAFKLATPSTKIVVMLPTYFTPSAAVFDRQYGEYGADLADPWRHRRVVRALTDAMITHFQTQGSGVYLAPTNAVMDTVDGYDPINPSHPNAYGNNQLAEALYASILAALPTGAAAEQNEPAYLAPRPPIGSPAEFDEALKSVSDFGGLLLPKEIELVAGETRRLYFKDFVPVRDPEVFDYSVDTSSPLVSLERRALVLSVPEDGKGEFQMTFRASKPGGAEVISASVTVRITPADAGRGKAYKILMVGDSLGHQSRFPNALYGLFSRVANPAMTFLGTHKPAGALVSHEQYGGWTFSSFLSNFGLDPAIYHSDRSPFVFAPATPGGQPVFDVSRYVRDSLKGERPDFVHIQLGINDAFLVMPDDPRRDEKIHSILDNADRLVAGIRSALPDAVISIGTVIPGNGSDRAYVESYPNYPKLHGEWRWRQTQLRMVRFMMKRFENRQSEGLYVLPTHLSLDALDGYSAHVFVPKGVTYSLSHAVHPTPVGDEEVAAPIYAFLKAYMVRKGDE